MAAKFYQLNKLVQIALVNPCYNVINNDEYEGEFICLDRSAEFWCFEGVIDNKISYYRECDNKQNIKLVCTLVWNIPLGVFEYYFSTLEWAVVQLDIYSLNRKSKRCAAPVKIASNKSGYAFSNRWEKDIVLATLDQVGNGPLTNVCTKCGYRNDYMDPVAEYVCTQCRMRDESWR